MIRRDEARSGIPLTRRLNVYLARRPVLRAGVRSVIGHVNTPIAKRRLRKEILVSRGLIRLEVGGLKRRQGWIVTNVNAVTRLYMDATRPWPFGSDTVECVYSDNVIEHLTLSEVRHLLTEARRCLRVGGAIRLVTPDLRAHVDMYLQGESALGGDVAAHYRGGGLQVEYPLDLIRIPVAAFGHHAGYIFDFDTLATELRMAGFSKISRCKLGDSEIDHFVGMDTRSEAGGAQLAVEATAL